MNNSKVIKILEKSYLYVIIMLPLAAIILRLSVLFDLPFLALYGETIYKHLPIMYAMAVAYGFAKNHSSIAVFSSAIGYILFEVAYIHINPENDIYILGGILSGMITVILFNWFTEKKFNGAFEILNEDRHIPIITSVALFTSGNIFGLVWPLIGKTIKLLSVWITEAGEFGTFIYGTLNRLLLPLGLHHNLNQYLWYEYGDYKGVSGDLYRFIAGDPTAGKYMSGFYVIMMFGLPALMYAFYKKVNRDNRVLIKGMYLISALISIATGITEPIELLFLFLMPKLYIIHALLTGLALATVDFFNINIGFDFSAGLIDYITYSNKQAGSHYILIIGVIFAIVYYYVTKIYVFNKEYIAPGDYVESDNNQSLIAYEFVKDLIDAFGGEANIKYVNIKYTRFEFKIKSTRGINCDYLNKLEHVNFITVGERTFQVITGNQGKFLKSAIIKQLKGKVI